MFENDKGKGIFMRKRNAQYFSAKQFYPNTWNVQNLHMPITIEACFQNTSILVWLAMASISSAISSDESLI